MRLVEIDCLCGAQIARGGKTAGGRLEELGFESVPPELDLVEINDQITHQVSLEESDTYNAQIALDLFKPDDNYQEEEKKYEVGTPCAFPACNHRTLPCFVHCTAWLCHVALLFLVVEETYWLHRCACKIG